jgi:RsiW-degrading membrane proteinase PrsW (M82 family)
MSLASLANYEVRRRARRLRGTEQKFDTSNALNALVKYIPTETITLYVASVSAMSALQKTLPSWINPRTLYWLFGILSPILLALVYLGDRRSAGLPVWPRWDWPWWRLIAAFIAFCVWALSIPGNPFVEGEGGSILAALGTLFVSAIFSLVERIVGKGGSETS